MRREVVGEGGEGDRKWEAEREGRVRGREGGGGRWRKVER